MSQKQKDIFQKYAEGQMPRREFLEKTAKFGLAAGAAHLMLTQAATDLFAGNFNWKKFKGNTLKLLLNKHPYTDAMIANINTFKKLTGMNVKYDVFPEDVYFDKVTAALSSRSKEYDAFMTGAYQTWTYGPAGWIEDLSEWIEDSDKTAPDYDWNDMLPGLRASTAWNGVPGSELGTSGSKQWCIPWGYELNSISYNRRFVEKAGVEPPRDLDDLLDIAQKLTKDLGGPYGIGVRGSRSWATIHPGFLSAYANYGQKDFTIHDGQLKAAMNTRGSKNFHRKWVKMIQDSGPKNWATYTWYQVGTDLGAGASAMIYDADILGYFMNGEGNKESGNLGFMPFTPNPNADAPTPNVWIWSLAMSRFSRQKDAAWYFMQWASGLEHGLFGARKMDFVNPVRQTVWDDTTFRNRIADSYPGYLEQHDQSAPGAKIHFTPQPLFFDLTTQWAEMLQKMVANSIAVDEGLDQLAENVNQQLEDAGLR